MITITKSFIITDKGRKAGVTCDEISKEVNRIACATEYDYYGQIHLYASSYFKDNNLVGVRISADKECIMDNVVKYMVEQGYLMED